MVWQLVSSRNRWRLRSWPDGAVLFDEASGSCHALTSAAEVVCRQCLDLIRVDAHALAAQLFGDESLPEDTRAIELVLEQFGLMGFVEPAEAIA